MIRLYHAYHLGQVLIGLRFSIILLTAKSHHTGELGDTKKPCLPRKKLIFSDLCHSIHNLATPIVAE